MLLEGDNDDEEEEAAAGSGEDGALAAAAGTGAVAGGGGQHQRSPYKHAKPENDGTIFMAELKGMQHLNSFICTALLVRMHHTILFRYSRGTGIVFL